MYCFQLRSWQWRQGRCIYTFGTNNTLLVQTVHFWYKQYTFGTNRTLLVQTVGSQAYNVRMSETLLNTDLAGPGMLLNDTYTLNTNKKLLF